MAAPATPPRLRHAPVEEITPEKMKQSCMIADAYPLEPTVLQFDNDSDENESDESDDEDLKIGNGLEASWAVDPWIKAHQEAMQPHVQAVIKKIQYVSHFQFVTNLKLSFQTMVAHLEGVYHTDDHHVLYERSIVLAEEEKSNLWVAELALHYFQFDAGRYMDLGLNSADKFTDLFQSIASSHDMDVVRSKFFDRTIILFDDASYSGKQLCNHLKAVKEVVAKHGLKIKGICIVAPYMTPYARGLLEAEAAKKVKKFAAKVFVAPSQPLRMLSDLPAASYLPIISLWYKGNRADADKIGLAYFEHKIPNDQSFPGPLIRGSVYHLLSGKASSQPISYSIFGDVVPVYKGKFAKRFELCSGKENVAPPSSASQVKTKQKDGKREALKPTTT